MTRTFSFLFLFLFLASCGKGGGGGAGNQSKSVAELTDAEVASEAVPTQALTFDVNAQLIGFSREHEDKILKGIELVKKVVASDEFKQKVLNHTYKGKKQYVDNGGLTNAQVYKKLLEGAEMLNPEKNNTMDIQLESYYESNIVIGYTMPSILKVFMNEKYLDQSSFQANQVAMNLMHEWLHKLGFKHAQDNSPSRPHSVPYAIGYIVRDLAKKLE
jgi:hypothetical protein